jgi:hypothetical protein
MSTGGIDQDALAAAWGAELEAEEAAGQDTAVAAEWADLIDQPGGQAPGTRSGPERILNQDGVAGSIPVDSTRFSKTLQYLSAHDPLMVIRSCRSGHHPVITKM